MSQDPARHIAPVLFTCTAKGAPVLTGLRLRPAEFVAITGPRAFRCAACGEIHTWTNTTAWLQGQAEVA